MTVVGVCTVALTLCCPGVMPSLVREMRGRREAHRLWAARERARQERGFE